MRFETLNDPAAGYLDRNAEDALGVRKKAATPLSAAAPCPEDLGA